MELINYGVCMCVGVGGGGWGEVSVVESHWSCSADAESTLSIPFTVQDRSRSNDFPPMQSRPSCTERVEMTGFRASPWKYSD